MELILWRHAEAVDGIPDMARNLTARGKKQAEEMGKWLRARLPAQTRILVSPARRTLQTAEALTDKFEVVRHPERVPARLRSSPSVPARSAECVAPG